VKKTPEITSEFQRWVGGAAQLPAERPPAASSVQRPAGDGPPRLPRWPRGTAGFPVPFVCSSLFAATARHEPVERVRSLPVAALAGIRLRYTGYRLSQRDADVFLRLLVRANVVPLGEPVRFTAHSLLVDLGWDTSSRGYARLRDSILKLTASALECEWTTGPGKRLRCVGALIGAFAWKDEVADRTLREWTIRLEPELVALLDESSHALVRLSARRLLGNHELAKWLHAYLAAHLGGTCTVRAAKLRELCGSKAKTLFGFRRTLRHALDILVERRLIEGYRIDPDRDLVSFGVVPPVRSSSRTVKPDRAAAAASQGTALMAYATRPLGQLKLAQ